MHEPLTHADEDESDGFEAHAESTIGGIAFVDLRWVGIGVMILVGVAMFRFGSGREGRLLDATGAGVASIGICAAIAATFGTPTA